MRRDRLLQMAEYLESGQLVVDFDLSTWYSYSMDAHGCGTCACIAGHAVILSAGGAPDRLSLSGKPVGISIDGHLQVGGATFTKAAVSEHARLWFELTPEDANLLFCPDGIARSEVTAVQAAGACRAFANGGRDALLEYWGHVSREQCEKPAV